MARLSDKQMRLYRRLLVRAFGPQGLCNGVEAEWTGKIDLKDGCVMLVHVNFDRSSGCWKVIFQVDGAPSVKVHSVPLLEHIVYLVNEEPRAYEDWLDWKAEKDGENEALLAADLYVEEALAAIKPLSDVDLIKGYEDAIAEDLRASTCVEEWGWHPAYTGPDDPGREHYKHQADDAAEILDAYATEMKVRNLYDAHHRPAFDRALTRQNYEDEDGVPRFDLPANRR